MIFGDRLRLPLSFDPARLKRDLGTLARDGWIGHFVKDNYEGEWDAVPLRGPRGAKHPVQMIYSDPGCRDFADTPILTACPYFSQVLAAFECPLHAVRLLRLGPGSIIKEHADHDLSFEQGIVRIHIPVETNPDVEFLLNGRRVVLEAGSVWYLRLSDRHSVANRGATARVHMVIDAVVNDWVSVLFRSAGDAGERAAQGDLSTSLADLPLPAAAVAPPPDEAATLEALHALVLQDSALRRRLSAIEGETATLQAVSEEARAHGIPVSRESLLKRMREKTAARSVWRGSAPDLSDWLPGACFWRDGEFLVEWVCFGSDRLDPSSFEQSVRIAARRPFNRLFRFVAPASSLDQAAESTLHLKPAGFLFHMSRCGSTLVSRQLGALSDSIVVSEAGVIDAVLRARSHPALDEAKQLQWLISLVAVLGRRRNEADTPFFVKFDAWHTLFLPLIRQAFPSVPWVFLYRDPVEVLVSLMRRPALHAVSGMLPGMFGVPEGESFTSREDYAAKVLGRIMEAASEHAECGQALLINYCELADGGDAIMRHFGVAPSDVERRRIAEVALQDAKQPYLVFAPDGAAKRAEASALERSAAERLVGTVYRRLEALRLNASLPHIDRRCTISK